MPATHRIIITAEALSNLQGIAAYIRKDSPQNAAAVARAIVDTVDSLAKMPTRFRRVGKSRKRGSPVHAVVVRPFIIYYRVDPQPAAVFVLQVLHGKRRQPRRFD
jgi:plasmid stabilization system protein ParE